ncbi:MAG: RNA-binding S4 domain-containing protein [Marmoricola sp.]
MRFRKRKDAESSDDPIDDVPIKDEVIRLGQFLKLANLVDSGADAKLVIAEGEVLVDGEVELRRGRQLRAGTIVEHAGRRARVTQDDGEIDVPW